MSGELGTRRFAVQSVLSQVAAMQTSTAWNPAISVLKNIGIIVPARSFRPSRGCGGVCGGADSFPSARDARVADKFAILLPEDRLVRTKIRGFMAANWTIGTERAAYVSSGEIQRHQLRLRTAMFLYAVLAEQRASNIALNINSITYRCPTTLSLHLEGGRLTVKDHRTVGQVEVEEVRACAATSTTGARERANQV